MILLPTLGDYIAWHYTKAIRDMYIAWGNMTWAVLHFFSVPLLLRTFFSPWKRMEESGGSGGIEGFFESVVVNLLSRIVGVFVRFWLILLGLLALIGMVIGIIVVTVVWLLAPFIGIGATVFGFATIF